MGRFNAVMEFFLCILSAAVITVGGFLIMQGQMNTVDLITFSLYITTFVNPVRQAVQLFGAAGQRHSRLRPLSGADAGRSRR